MTTLAQVLVSSPVWRRLTTTQQPPARVAWKLGCLLGELQPIMDRYTKAKDELLARYARPEPEPAPPGQQQRFHFRVSDDPDAEIDQDRLDKFNDEWNDLVQVEVNVETKLSIEDIEDCKLDPGLSGVEMNAIDWMISPPA